MNQLLEMYGSVISVYSRAQMFEDGELVDVTELANSFGIHVPTALTRAVFEGYVVPDERARKHGQSEAGRLRDIVWLLRFAAWKNQSSRIVYTVRVVMKEALQRDVQLKAIIGPGDDGEPVITIMTLDEPEN